MANLAGMPVCFSAYSNSWIIDSSASDHMVSNLKLLSSITPFAPSTQVNLPDGHTCSITHKGSTSLSDTLSLDNPLCSTFRHNLLLVSKLTRSLNYSVTFYPDSCV